MYPDAYVAALCGRSVAVHNRAPAPRTFDPVRKPRHYDLVAARRDRAFKDPNFLDAPPRLSATPWARPLGVEDDGDEADACRRCLSDDEIANSSDDEEAPAAPKPAVLSTDDFFNSW